MTTLGRRQLFQIAGTTGAVAFADSCADIAPRPVVRRRAGPESTVNTVCAGCGAGCGIHVRLSGDDTSRVTGVPGHPVNDGGLCPRGIASIQDLYHPDRLQSPAERSGQRGSGLTRPITWDAAIERITHELTGPVVVAVGDVSTLDRVALDRLVAKLNAKAIRTDLQAGRRPAAALELMYGSAALGNDFAKADVLLSLGCDWLQAWESPVEAQRLFAALRRRDKPVRMLAADDRLSTTAARSDSWLPVAREDLAYLALVLARTFVDADGSRADRIPELAPIFKDKRLSLDEASRRLGLPKRQVERWIEMLHGARRPAVMVDAGQPPAVQVAGMVLQLVAGEPGSGLIPLTTPAPLAPPLPVTWSDTLQPDSSSPCVLLVGANPVYLDPQSPWSDLLRRARFVAALTEYADESAALADVILPVSSALESRHLVWGATVDGRAFVTGGPAAVKPLGTTRESFDVLTRILRAVDPSSPWKTGDDLIGAAADALRASKLLDGGGFAQPDVPAASALPLVAGVGARIADLLKPALEERAAGAGELKLHTYVPLAFLGGHGAHLPYLHGLTGPGGREVWRTVVELHPDTAKRADLNDGDPVVVDGAHSSVRGVVRLRQGIRPDTVAIAAGLGHSAGGQWATGHGDNPLTIAAPGTPADVRIRRA